MAHFMISVMIIGVIATCGLTIFSNFEAKQTEIMLKQELQNMQWQRDQCRFLYKKGTPLE
jgi:Tfp pilus assembly major pilin PilA